MRYVRRGVRKITVANVVAGPESCRDVSNFSDASASMIYSMTFKMPSVGL